MGSAVLGALEREMLVFANEILLLRQWLDWAAHYFFMATLTEGVLPSFVSPAVRFSSVFSTAFAQCFVKEPVVLAIVADAAGSTKTLRVLHAAVTGYQIESLPDASCEFDPELQQWKSHWATALVAEVRLVAQKAKAAAYLSAFA